jgi:phosphate transport system substrate-binding protein
MRARRLLLALLAGACVAAVSTVPAPASPSSPNAAGRPASPAGPAAAPAAINGSGSTYVALAMDLWTSEAQTRGLDVNYTPSGSPQGLALFRDRSIDYAGTEAEFSSLGIGSDNAVARGFQYVPDVAGAVAIMYNAQDEAGRHVDYLRLSRSTVAKIFMGFITHWSDPQITNDLGGQIQLPHQPITVVYRGTPSGTTALFYDFVQNTEPQLFAQWAAEHRMPTTTRIIDLSGDQNFAPSTNAQASSDAIASYVARTPWSIGYDEFGYAQVYGNDVAWIQNAAGAWVKPYAANITAALETAYLRPDLSQDLRNVYASPNPGAYPISAYSYMVTQCAAAGDRPTCKGNYPNTGVAETLDAFMRYVACEGQIQMADIGYAPLPPQLSQFIADAVGRMWGRGAETLTRENCANPRFDPNYLPPGGEQPPPLPEPPGVGNLGSAGNNSRSTTTGAVETATTGAAAGSETAAAGRAGEEEAVGGGSDDWRNVDPVAFNRPGMARIGQWPLLVLLLVLLVPVVGGMISRAAQQGRLRRAELGLRPPPPPPPDPDPPAS